MEQWIELKGYEKEYKVSNFGNIMSVGRAICNGYGRITQTEDRILKGHMNSNGYICVCIKQKTKSIHRLIKEHFEPIENSELMEVHHLDGNRTNNCNENLQWLTKEEHIAIHRDNGLRDSIIELFKKGKKCSYIVQALGIHKNTVSNHLKQYKVNRRQNICEDFESGMTIKELSIKHNVSLPTVRSIVK